MRPLFGLPGAEQDSALRWARRPPHNAVVQRASANVIRAASFLLGSAGAVLLAWSLGLIDIGPGGTDRRPRSSPTERAEPLADTPKAAPIATQERPGPEARNRSTAKPAPKPRTPPPPPRATPARPLPPPEPQRDLPSPALPVPDEPASMGRARAAMRRLTENRASPPTPGELTDAARTLDIAAKELGREDVVLCVERFYLGRSAQRQESLVKCWRKLLATVR